jgi:hypothetical protein
MLLQAVVPPPADAAREAASSARDCPCNPPPLPDGIPQGHRRHRAGHHHGPGHHDAIIPRPTSRSLAVLACSMSSGPVCHRLQSHGDVHNTFLFWVIFHMVLMLNLLYFLFLKLLQLEALDFATYDLTLDE